MNCAEINLDNLDWCEGTPILQGIRGVVYAIPKKHIVKWPKLPAITADNIKQAAIYDGAFTLAAEKKWKRIGVTVGKSPVSSESQGEQPSQTSLNSLTLFHPGIEEEATAFARVMNNGDYVFLFQTKTGKFRVLGNEMYQTMVKASQNLGAGPTDEAGTTFVATVTDVCPPPFYTGAIVTDDGEITQG